jgi:hypothetical protein
MEATGWKQHLVGELDLCSMVKITESLINVVKGKQAKVADKPEPKGAQWDALV